MPQFRTIQSESRTCLQELIWLISGSFNYDIAKIFYFGLTIGKANIVNFFGKEKDVMLSIEDHYL